MLTLHIAAHVVQKEGTEPRHCEDAFAYDVQTGRAAVADGASDAFEAGVWARLLAAMFVHTPPACEPSALLSWLRVPVKAWQDTVRWDDLPWYAEQKAREVGGLATFLGFSLQPAPAAADDATKACWTALAVGDACLLQFRERSVLARFPVEHAEAFGTTPALLSTRQDHNKAMLEAGGLRLTGGTCRAGDLFLLATDAMAEWLYRLPDLDTGRRDLPDWETISRLLEEDFPAVVERLRARSSLRNDDVTVLVLRVVEKAKDAAGLGAS